MIIGVPKEIKNNENRVALTPAGAMALTKRGHQVFVQASAGEGSGFSDAEYEAAGATMLPTIEATYEKAEMIIKVKEPIEPEYKLIKEGQLVFTYFHFASYEPLTKAMVESGATCLAYETVELPDRSLPLLVPMSEVAGRMSVQEGAKYLEKPVGGRGDPADRLHLAPAQGTGHRLYGDSHAGRGRGHRVGHDRKPRRLLQRLR